MFYKFIAIVISSIKSFCKNISIQLGKSNIQIYIVENVDYSKSQDEVERKRETLIQKINDIIKISEHVEIISSTELNCQYTSNDILRHIQTKCYLTTSLNEHLYYVESNSTRLLGINKLDSHQVKQKIVQLFAETKLNRKKKYIIISNKPIVLGFRCLKNKIDFDLDYWNGLVVDGHYTYCKHLPSLIITEELNVVSNKLV
jgi:hypothetical protein